MLKGWVEQQFFHPDRTVYSTPQQFGLACEDVVFEGPAGCSLHGWWLPARVAAGEAAHGTVLHLHGNAGNVSTHLPLVAWLPAAGFELFTFDYRGYGRSEGSPSLDGLVQDGLAALAWLRRRPGVDPQKLVVLGQSLGGATAVRLVHADPQGVKLLVLDCAFASYRRIAHEAVAGTALSAFAPAAMFVLPPHHDDPEQVIRGLKTPVFVLHSEDDAVVPLSHGQALYAAAPEPKRWLGIQATQHVDGLTHEPVRQQVIAAMRSALQAA